MKACSRKNCTEVNPQPLTAFGKCSRLPSGLRPECKACRRAESAAAYKADPHAFLRRNELWAMRNPYKAKQVRKESELKKHPYRRFKEDKCCECSFVPIDMCQLHVDHINGDHSDNRPSNLQTLCANCHALKTKRNRDGVKPRKGQVKRAVSEAVS